MIQRSRENSGDYGYKSFFATGDRPELADLSEHYPKRWHIEEFFKANPALGWQRAGTLNLNILYATVSDSRTEGGGTDRVSWSVGRPAARRVGGGSIQSPHP